MDAHSEIRLALKTEFETRVARNQNYSLRAFARFLDVQPSALSEIFAGKRKISKRMAVRCLNRIGIDEIRALKLTEKMKSARASRNEAPGEVNLHDLGRACSWRHFAVLSFCQARGAAVSDQAIAEHLRLAEADAQTLINDLIAANLLTRAGGGLRGSERQLTILLAQPGVNEIHLMKEHARAAEASLGHEHADQSFIEAAAGPKEILEIKRRLEKFRRGVSAYLERSKSKSMTVRLAIQLFPVPEK